MDWWIWVVAGLGFCVAEIMTPGAFVFIFFGAGALLVGAGVGAGWLPEFWQQSLAGVGFSIANALLFRKRLLSLVTPKAAASVDTVAGELAVAREAIAVQGSGKVEFRGTTWSAKNTGEVAIAVGGRCRVERLDGITLWLRAE